MNARETTENKRKPPARVPTDDLSRNSWRAFFSVYTAFTTNSTQVEK